MSFESPKSKLVLRLFQTYLAPYFPKEYTRDNGFQFFFSVTSGRGIDFIFETSTHILVNVTLTGMFSKTILSSSVGAVPIFYPAFLAF